MTFPCPGTEPNDHGGPLERFAASATYWTGTTSAFILALALILVWLAVGHHFGYSDTWQLVVNTGTTIITFLMVFLIQRAQNRETLSNKIQMAELIRAITEANDRMIDLDDLSEKQLRELEQGYLRGSRVATDPGILRAGKDDGGRPAAGMSVAGKRSR